MATRIFSVFLKVIWISICAFFSLGCFSISYINLKNSGSLVADSPTPSFKSESFPTAVPEGFPYYATPQIENFDSNSIYALLDSTCSGLQINTNTGVISGDLKLVQGESCQYRVQAASNGKTLLSDLILVQVETSLDLTFSETSGVLQKGGSNFSVDLNFSSPTPFDTFLKYKAYSTNATTGIISLGAGTSVESDGDIFIPKGSVYLPMIASLPSSAIFSGTDVQYLKLENGSKGRKPEVGFILHENPIPNFDKVSANADHACAITSGKLYCWGKNDSGQIGNGASSSLPVTAPYRVGSSTTWQEISTGQSFSCGIDAGRLYCWGIDFSGQMGNGGGSSANVLTPQQIGASTTWQVIAAGDVHVCGIDNGAAYCWGANGSGAIGYGVSGADVTAPVQVGVSTTWTSIAAGLHFTCGINTGELYCWGADNQGQLGNSSASSANVLSPEKIGVSTTWQAISTAKQHTCGINLGQLFCWGFDGWGQQGNGSVSSANVHDPTVVNSSTTWQQIDVDGHHSCGIDAGKLYCWGANGAGQVGNGVANPVVHSPTQIGLSTSWQFVSSGVDHTCGIENGKLQCWGTPNGVGLASVQQLAIPLRQVGVLDTWQKVSAGYSITCGIQDGRLYCWGGASSITGASATAVRTPERIGFLTNWQTISVFETFACGIESGKLFCWGSNGSGELGLGVVGADINTPQRVGTSTSWSSVEVGNQYACGIDAGRVFCWGDNSDGSVGDGTGVGPILTPKQVGASSTWSSISVGMYHVCGINLGELYCWGADFDGQIGNGPATSTDVLAPVRIGASSTWQSISAHSYGHTCGIDNGELYCWGRDFENQVGNGSASPADVRSPEKIGVSTTWQSIFLGLRFSCGIDAGRLFCWGGDFAGPYSPTQSGVATDWQTGGGGHEYGCYIGSGKLYCSGLNDTGQAGIGLGSIYKPEILLEF